MPRSPSLAALALCAVAIALSGCAIADPAPAVKESAAALGSELLTARDLGPFLDDVDEPVNETIFTATSSFMDEVERQVVVSERQRTIIARDEGSVVTIAAIRFNKTAFGRALVRPKGSPDHDPPRLPSGGLATIGELRSDYAERAVVFAKGPTFVRLEVICTTAHAVSRCGSLLSRAARLQFSKLRSAASLAGETLDVGRLKRGLAVSSISTALLLVLGVALLAAIRDPATWQRVMNRVRLRPKLPPHAIDVDASARATRRELASESRHRLYVAFVVLALVEILPLGLKSSAVILGSSLVAWDLSAMLTRHLLSDLLGRPAGPRLYSGRGLLIGALASSLSIGLAAVGPLIGWDGIVVQKFGARGAPISRTSTAFASSASWWRQSCSCCHAYRLRSDGGWRCGG
jgi:hypothetical protein